MLVILSDPKANPGSRRILNTLPVDVNGLEYCLCCSNSKKIIAELWCPPPVGANHFTRPAFIRLVDYCKAIHSNAGAKMWLTMALFDALRSLGMPVRPKSDKASVSLSPTEAAHAIHLAFTAARRVHLCPLDWAENPPDVLFGQSTMRLFSEKELMDLAEAERIQRAFPSSEIDWKRLSRFHWLIVEEDVPLTTEPGARALPIMYKPPKRDLGAFLPHQGQFPQAVEEALFLLLLGPWEEWVEEPKLTGAVSACRGSIPPTGTSSSECRHLRRIHH
jgi:hypothetical protein